MLNKLITTIFIAFCSLNSYATQSSLNGFAGNIYAEKPLKNVTVNKNKVEYTIDSNDKNVVPIVQTHIEINLTNNSDNPNTFTLGLPIWHAESAMSQEEKIVKNLHLTVALDEQPLKIEHSASTEKESAWLAKLFTWQVTLPPHATKSIHIHYDLPFSVESITANEQTSTVIGKSGFYNHNEESYGHTISEKIAVVCDLKGLKEFITDNKKVQAFLGHDGKNQKSPLRTVEVQNFPNYSKDHWLYSWEDHNKQYGFSFEVYNLPTNFADFKTYYANYKRTHTTAQLAVWDAMLQKIYTHAYEDVINDNRELAKIVDFLHR